MVVGVTYLELGFALLPREGRLSKLRMEATYLSWEYEELAKGCVCHWGGNEGTFGKPFGTLWIHREGIWNHRGHCEPTGWS